MRFCFYLRFTGVNKYTNIKLFIKKLNKDA